MTIRLRALEGRDLDELFRFERDPAAVEMAAFTRADPSDRVAFDAHQRRIRDDPDATVLAIERDGAFAGTIGSFTMEGCREVTYWVDPARWGQGIAGAALRAFLSVETTRPLFGRVAEHNAGSARVLERVGFREIGRETAYADGLGRKVVERIYRLER
ncbi:MAG TPA: GNAT family N-acetyltransferase [Solirubrobacteraceae bacterium]|nr:GNAT family N-acetyltransferase [Solirubrobacteraceae bacterium]